MEPISPLPDNAAKAILEAQIRECFGRVVYSHKTHEKCADILLNRLSWLKHTQIVLSVLVSGSLLTAMLGDQPSKGIIPAVLSGILVFINLYFKNYNYGQMAQTHKETADRLWNVRESYLSLLTDLVSDIVTLSQAADKRDKLQKELATIYSRAPRTNSNAYAKAQQALKYNEDLTFSVEEIDAFLPNVLKKSKQEPALSPTGRRE
jgi:hypothetical protein